MRGACFTLLSCLLAACNGDDAVPPDDSGNGANCLADVSRECDLAFSPTYDAFFDNLLGRTCGASSTGGSCHGPEGGMAGLFLHDRDMAYDYLLGDVDGRARVVPSDPECSVLVQRITSEDPDFAMPPGAPLIAEERCSIVRWIDMGAER